MQTIKLQNADAAELGCGACRDNEHHKFDLSFAFQPIVRASTRAIVSYEALARGPDGQGFAYVQSQINDDNLYKFDQTCRVKAIELATKLDLKVALNINFTPNAVYRPELCIRTTLAAAREFGFPVDMIHFEVTESEEVREKAHLVSIIETYKKLGFTTAIDDFGAGYSGLNLLAEFQPDYIKIDRTLIDHVDQKTARQAIIQGVILTCRKLNIDVLAEGVEREEEYRWLVNEGVDLFQGYSLRTRVLSSCPRYLRNCFNTPDALNENRKGTGGQQPVPFLLFDACAQIGQNCISTRAYRRRPRPSN